MLLRNVISSHSIKMPAEHILHLRQQFACLWATELDPTILKRLAHIMAQSSQSSPWTDLLPYILSQTNSTNTVASLNLIEITTDYCPNDLILHLEALGVYLCSFITSTDVSIQIACAKTTTACIVSLSEENHRNLFRPALQPIVNVIGVCLQSGFETDATSILSHLVTVAASQPVFFKGTLDAIMPAMVAVVSYTNLDFSTRIMAFEMMITLTETAPALARRCDTLVKNVIPLAFSIMLDVEEDNEEFASGKYSDADISDENASAGDEAIERLANGLGGRVIAEQVLAHVGQYSTNSSSWQHRRAAVAGLYRLAEGCSKSFKSYTTQAIHFIAIAVNDTSVRVRFEAIRCIGRLAVLYPQNATVLINTFVPTLTSFLSDASACSRIRGLTAAALINLVSNSEVSADVIQNYLQSLLQALVVSLQNAPIEVQPHCLTLLGYIAETAQETFIPFYSSFMPGIKSILAAATAPDQALLRGKAMQCAGLVGNAVGVKVFAGDALELMNLMISCLGQEDIDSVFDYILPACADISKALGPHFEQFLPTIMPPLIDAASREIKFSVADAIDGEEGEITQDEESGVITYISANKRFTIDPRAYKQKEDACNLLYDFADNLKGHLKAFILPALKSMLSLICLKDVKSGIASSEDVRSSAAEAIARLFEAYIDAVKKGFLPPTEVDNVFYTIAVEIMKSLSIEINDTVRICTVEAFNAVLEGCYKSGKEAVDGSYADFICKPTMDVSKAIVTELLARCVDCLKRRSDVSTIHIKNEGVEADDAADEVEKEEDLLRTLIDCIGILLKLSGEDFMPVFDSSIAPAFSMYLASSQPEALQIMAVCMIDDAIEFGGSSAHKYIPQSLQVFANNLSSGNNLLRQCSSYGIAQAARVAPNVFAQYLPTLMPLLVQTVSHPAASEEDNEGNTENCLFALGAVCTNPVYRDSSINWSGAGITINEVASLWLKGLPLKAEEAEAKCAHHQLCNAIESSDGVIVGDSYANAYEILRIISDILLYSSDSPELAIAHCDTLERMRFIAKSVMTAVPPAAYSQLSVEMQQVLHSLQ